MLYQKIKALCDEHGISIRECENRAGLGNGTIGGWKEKSPRLDKLLAVAKALGVPITALIEDKK